MRMVHSLLTGKAADTACLKLMSNYIVQLRKHKWCICVAIRQQVQQVLPCKHCFVACHTTAQEYMMLACCSEYWNRVEVVKMLMVQMWDNYGNKQRQGAYPYTTQKLSLGP